MRIVLNEYEVLSQTGHHPHHHQATYLQWTGAFSLPSAPPQYPERILSEVLPKLLVSLHPYLQFLPSIQVVFSLQYGRP